jgi:hypothetical protein
MTMESGFPLTLHFATLYFEKNPNLYFLQRKEIYSKTSFILIECVNHYEEHCVG